jgi:hypothetical protein
MLTDSLAEGGWRSASFTGHIEVPWMIGVLAGSSTSSVHD